MTINPQPAFGPAEPADAYSRLLDVVIASSPSSQADTLNALRDAIIRYQHNGPMQRITLGERQLLDQLHILAMGELLTAGSRRSAAARSRHVPAKPQCLGCSDSDALRRLAGGSVPHAKDCPHGKRDELGFPQQAVALGEDAPAAALVREGTRSDGKQLISPGEAVHRLQLARSETTDQLDAQQLPIGARYKRLAQVMGTSVQSVYRQAPMAAEVADKASALSHLEALHLQGADQ